MENLTFKLPSGLSVTVRELNGNDSAIAASTAAKYDSETLRPRILGLAEIGQTVVKLGEKPGPVEYSELMRLGNRDQQALMITHERRNTMSIEEHAALEAQMGPGTSARAAILDCLMLTRLQVMPFAEAMKMPIKERQMLLETIAKALGLDKQEAE